MTQNERQLFYDSNKSKLYLYNNKIHKLFKGLVTEELENQVYYNMLIRSNLDKRIIMPSALIPDEDGWIIGYIMDYIKGTTISKTLCHDNLDFEDKSRLINDFFYLLQNVHNYLTVGDVRNSNLMIGNDNNAYMIDFDFAVKNGSSKVPFVSYQLYYDDEYLNDKNGDIIKMFISALSLLYDYNLEYEMKHYENIEYLKNFVPYSGILRDYFEYCINKIYRHEQIDEYLDIPIEENIQKDVLIKKKSLFN